MCNVVYCSFKKFVGKQHALPRSPCVCHAALVSAMEPLCLPCSPCVCHAAPQAVSAMEPVAATSHELSLSSLHISTLSRRRGGTHCNLVSERAATAAAAWVSEPRSSHRHHELFAAFLASAAFSGSWGTASGCLSCWLTASDWQAETEDTLFSPSQRITPESSVTG